MISVIVGFRNRETERVINFLNSFYSQSFKKYELIFCDYGSDIHSREEVERIAKSYDFVNYIYCDTRGQFWNRSHALNIGAKYAKFDNLLFADIDLIFSDQILSKLKVLDTEKYFYTFQCFYSNHRFDNYLFDDYLIQHSKINYVGLCFLSKNLWMLVGGYDEYFMYWGAEDDDFYRKLTMKGIENVLLDIQDYPIIHQWHEVQKMAEPTPWYLDMVYRLYSFVNFEKVSKEISFGNITTTNDRLLLPPFQDLFFIEIDLFPDKLYQFNVFMEVFFNLKPGTFAKFTYYFPIKFEISRKDKLVVRLNKLINWLNINYSIMKINKPSHIHSFKLWNEFIMLFIGRSRKSIRDYYLEINQDKAVLYFVKC